VEQTSKKGNTPYLDSSLETNPYELAHGYTGNTRVHKVPF